MIRHISRLVAIGLLSGGLLAAVSAPALAAPRGNDDTRIIHVSTASGPASQHLNLGVNKAAIVELDRDVHDVLVSSPEIVDAVVKTPRRIFLLAAKTGQTNAFFTDAAGRQILSLDIRVEKDTGDLASLMRETMPNSAIKVTAINDNVILVGTVSSALEAGRAVALAAGFTGDSKKVVNMLSVAGGEQVMLKVRVAEMDRSIAKQFGVNLSTAASANGVPIIASTSNPYGLLGSALSNLSGAQIGSVCSAAFIPSGSSSTTSSLTSGSTMVTQTTSRSVPCTSPNNAQGILNALETVGLVHILAEPNMIAVNGETAKFLAGGEFPVPTAKDNQGNVTLSFKQFGVGLSFTPVVQSANRISIQMSTEVSQLTNTGAFNLAGGSSTVDGVTTSTPSVTIPALQVRRAETTVELPSGGSFAIGGLMQHVTKQQIDGFPGLKDMPVLGALFRSRDFQNDESELVIIVSAYLVQPTTEAALTTPIEGFQPPTDPQTILLGRLNEMYRKNDKPLVPEAAAQVGFVVR